MTPAVQEFYERIADAYRSSPLEVALVVLLVVGLITGLAVYAARAGKRERRRQEALAQRLFDEKTRQASLSPTQMELLEQMRDLLGDPTQIHHLVTDEVTFNSTAARLREEGGVSAQAVAALRVSLGLHEGKTDRAPASSAAIPVGSTVLIARSKYRRPFKATVLEPLPAAFRVRVAEEGARLPAGAAVDVYFHSPAGVFTFRTTVLSEHDGVGELSHSEDLERYQKRRYYRKRIAMPAYLYPFDADLRLLSRFREIGGGGASLVNPDGHFKVGENVEIRFRPEEEEIRITGTVVRVSDSGRIIHVNFEHIREGVRDRIYRAIFKPPKDEQEAMQRVVKRPASPQEPKRTE